MRCAYLLLLCLPACGGSSGGSDAEPDAAVNYSNFQRVVTATGMTPDAQVPVSGSHNYTGQMQLDLPLDDSPVTAYYGALDLTLDMGSSTVAATGTADGFASAAGNVLDGALTVSGGLFLPDVDPVPLVIADLEGALYDGNDQFDLEAEMEIHFYATDATAVSGRVFSGSITHGAQVDVFDGTFAARKSP